jgi:hypothetical protein
MAPFANRVVCAGLRGKGVADCPELERLVRRLGEAAEQPVGLRLEHMLARLDEAGGGAG